MAYQNCSIGENSGENADHYCFFERTARVKRQKAPYYDFGLSKVMINDLGI